MTTGAVATASGLEALSSYLGERAKATGTPGTVVGLTTAEETVDVLVHGVADRETGTPVTRSTRFGIGSLTKTFTAAAVLAARERGRVDLDAPVTRYVPWFRPPAGQTGPLTVRHLLHHTGGLPSGGLQSPGSRQDLVDLAGAPAVEPGSRWWYSNLGYRLLGYALEESRGMPHSEVLAEDVLAPLGTVATAPLRRSRDAVDVAVGYQCPDDEPTPAAPRLVRSWWLPYGGNESYLAAPVDDVLRLVRMLLSGGATAGGRVLAPASFRELVAPGPGVTPGTAYGMGVYVRRSGDTTLLTHTGAVPGYRSAFLADLAEGTGVVVLTNGPANPAPLARHALAVLRTARHGQPPPDPPAEAAAHPGTCAGTYRCGADTLEVGARSGRPVARWRGRIVAVQPRGRYGLFLDHPDFADFLLSPVVRDGRVAELRHGPSVFVRHGAAAGTGAEVAPAGAGVAARPDLVGEYRAYNPWLTGFHVFSRPEGLVLVRGRGPDERLFPTGHPEVFRLFDPGCPEYLRFHVADPGIALACDLSGARYARA